MKSILAGLFFLASVAVSAQEDARIDHHFGNLMGTWKLQTDKGVVYEKWERVNDTLLSGSSYMVKDGQQIPSEELRIVLRKGKFYYEPIALNQNNNERISFAQKAVTKTKEKPMGNEPHTLVTVVFGDPEHDYPKYIRYTITASSLKVRIGNDEELKEGIDYVFTKEK